MIQNEIFVCGDGFLSHPVTYLFHLKASRVVHGQPSSESIAGKRLLIADCRASGAESIRDWTKLALTEGKPIVLLCPGADTMTVLAGAVGVLPSIGVAALLVRAYRNACNNQNFNVTALHYTVEGEAGEQRVANSKAAADGTPPESHGVAECNCTDAAAMATTFTNEYAVNRFKMIVEGVMEGRDPELVEDTPPAGLKYFYNTLSNIGSFTYKCNGTNGGGGFTYTCTVKGFLSQTASGNSQYIAVESRYSLSPGSLASNDQCDRGVGNGNLTVTLAAPAGMSPNGYVPTSGSGSFSGTVSFEVSYANPLGGYGIWNYSDSVSYNVDSWTASSANSGATLGTNWWATSPCNMSNFNDDWDDAFSTWGHVNDLPSASSGTLDVSTISAWFTNNLLNGSQSFPMYAWWQGMEFWGSSCSPGMYWKINAQVCGFNWKPSLYVDFSQIQP